MNNWNSSDLTNVQEFHEVIHFLIEFFVLNIVKRYDMIWMNIPSLQIAPNNLVQIYGSQTNAIE